MAPTATVSQCITSGRGSTTAKITLSPGVRRTIRCPNRRVDAHTLLITNKKGDKVTINGRAVVSADGKTRTVTITGTDSKGNKFTSTAVYDKQ